MIEEIAARPRGNQNLEEWESSIDWYMVEELDFFFETTLDDIWGMLLLLIMYPQKFNMRERWMKRRNFEDILTAFFEGTWYSIL